MLKYYVKLNKKYTRKKVFDTQSQAEQEYRKLQDKYHTNAIIIGVVRV